MAVLVVVDMRFACRDAVRGAGDAMTVDLSFYNVVWYREITTDSPFDALGAQVAPQATASRAAGGWQRSGR